MQNKSKEIIRLNKIFKSYSLAGEEVPILKGIDLVIRKGEFIAIMGPSGSGKSTLLNILGCLDTATKGEYLLEDINISEKTEDELAALRSLKFGFIFQYFNLINEISALDNVLLPQFYTENENIPYAIELLKKVNLANRINHKPNELSGGQKQRVAIARALINNPEIIFADEPTGNLDSKNGKEILDMIQDLHKSGKTILMVTHDELIAEHADRIVRLQDGELLR
jgi:putative ABC transport system ATP-binding protein